MLIGSGLPLGEALALSWPDIDLDERKATVRRQLLQGEQDRILGTQDGLGAADRGPPFVVEALHDHQRRMGAESHLLTDRLLVFVDREGHPVRAENLRAA